MMPCALITLTAALAATLGNAVTFDTPLPYTQHNGAAEADCQGNLVDSGIILSVTAIGNGMFCESSISDNRIEKSFTRIDYIECNILESGTEIILYAYQCTDDACQDCNMDNVLEDVRMVAPVSEPLPAADSCWLFEIPAGPIMANRFNVSAPVEAESVNTYWQTYLENSCLKDTMVMTDAPEDSTPAVETDATEDSSSSANTDNSSQNRFILSLASFLTYVLTISVQ